jgi:hypothetical protein
MLTGDCDLRRGVHVNDPGSRMFRTETQLDFGNSHTGGPAHGAASTYSVQGLDGLSDRTNANNLPPLHEARLEVRARCPNPLWRPIFLILIKSILEAVRMAPSITVPRHMSGAPGGDTQLDRLIDVPCDHIGCTGHNALWKVSHSPLTCSILGLL